MLRQTINVLKTLRELNGYLLHEKKVHDWVGLYLDNCMLHANPVTILTPWSLSPRLEERYKTQNYKFSPSQNELKLFTKEIPYICNRFTENGFIFEWWIYIAPSSLDSTRLDIQIEKEYQQMLLDLAWSTNLPVGIVHLETDVLEKRQYPNIILQRNFNELVDNKSLESEIQRRTAKWKNLSLETLKEETIYKICCEAEEGRILMEENPFGKPGEFLFLSLNTSDKLNFFSTLVPEFEKRIVSVLKKYHWRL